MRILNLDVESTPAQVFTWDLRVRGFLSPEKVIIPRQLLCYAAKWVGDDDLLFRSEWRDGRVEMVHYIWDLLDQADAVLHYNGIRFDIPAINTEFACLGLPPPSPFAQIDLFRAAKTRFRFMSNSLDFVTKSLGTVRKLDSGGMELWIRVMDGDRAAQLEMETYNKGDVLANEDLYRYLLPWINGHPSHAVRNEENVCPQCGSDRLKPRGYAYTNVSKFQRFCCEECGKWSRATRRELGVQISGI